VADPAQSRENFEARLHSYVGLEEGPPYTCPDAVNEAMIRHWCEAMGDSNPAYLDPEAAERSVHGGIVAPPTMLQVWDMRGYAMHDPALLPPNKQRRLHGIFDAAGYTGVVATDTEQEFHRALRPGDRITAHTVIESISEQKTTALGIGYFVVTRTRMSDQQGEEVGSLSFRVLKFRPKQPCEDVDESIDSASSSR
jgi:acyl dehydratase